MKLTLTIALVLSTTACAPFLGTHVRHFSHAGVDYTHCSITVDRGHPELAGHALDVCRDAIAQGPQPVRH
jgi:hypothetical protein